MDGLREDTLYVVVEFAASGCGGLASIDLVPRGWVSLLDETYSCYYPPKKDYSKLNKWVKGQYSPGDGWREYPLNGVINEARDYEQGMRRLKRAMKDPISSDTDVNEREQSHPTILSEEEICTTLTANISLSNLQNENETLPTIDHLEASADETIMPNGAGEINVEYQPNYNNDELVRYLDNEFAKIKKQIEGARRSVLYDFEKKMNELKSQLVVSPLHASEQSSAIKKKINYTLPISNLEDFLKFDVELKEEEKTMALKMLFSSVIAGSKSSTKDIANMMAAVMTKNVQLKYSGYGRKMKNCPPKLNFSGTETFKCIKELLEQKFHDASEPLALLPKISRWLAGACDREGGRRKRETCHGTSENDDDENNNDIDGNTVAKD